MSAKLAILTLALCACVAHARRRDAQRTTSHTRPAVPPRPGLGGGFRLSRMLVVDATVSLRGAALRWRLAGDVQARSS
jgi:hypothetical protein